MLLNGVHLGYCSNIHPGEDWAEHFAQLKEYLPRVKRFVAPRAAFGFGLRLAAAAAEQLADQTELESFLSFLNDEELYVFTLNGFPYGAFHGRRVKENVYRPDWRRTERVSYSVQLGSLTATLLARQKALPAPGKRSLTGAALGKGSVSTVPLGFRADFSGTADFEAAAANLLRTVATYREIKDRTGVSVMLALEPEPACALETTAELTHFLEEFALRASARGDLSEATVREHLGVCLDLCHMAVQFEDPATVLRDLRRSGIRVGKVQISAGLELDYHDPEAKREPTNAALETMAREAFAALADPIYLHQTTDNAGGELTRYLDLPAAPPTPNAHRSDADSESIRRVHYHVPLFYEDRLPVADGPALLRTTRRYAAAVLALHRQEAISDAFEVETYTWDVLPAALRNRPIDAAVAAELAWAAGELRA